MSEHRETAEAAWRWVLAQVRHDDGGVWLPEQVPVDGPPVPPPVEQRDGMHSGTGGLALALVEIARSRPWTDPEAALASTVAHQVRDGAAHRTAVDWFDGLVSDIGVLVALGEPGVDACVARLEELGDADAWPRFNDATLGTGSVVRGGLDAAAAGVPAGLALAGRAADVLLVEAETTPAGLDWPFVPRRYADAGPDGTVQMPNWSHGVAGVAATLADAGVALDRVDLVDAARLGAEHLVTLRDAGVDADGGFAVPRRIPGRPGLEDLTWNWCHGPPGTARLFVTLEDAGVSQVAGAPPRAWHRRCLRATVRSGIPARLRPGFWDNDGRCCGTAGAGDAFLDAWDRYGDRADLAFASRLGDALVERAVRDGQHACWRFVEHRDEEPLLPPGVGWMQGAAGIAAYLFRLAGALDRAPAD